MNEVPFKRNGVQTLIGWLITLSGPTMVAVGASVWEAVLYVVLLVLAASVEAAVQIRKAAGR